MGTGERYERTSKNRNRSAGHVASRNTAIPDLRYRADDAEHRAARLAANARVQAGAGLKADARFEGAARIEVTGTSTLTTNYFSCSKGSF